jgi:hypothetical protein
LISLLLDGFILSEISEIVVLSLEVTLTELAVDALLDNCIVLQQHLAVLLLQHGEFMCEGFGIFSKEVDLARV